MRKSNLKLDLRNILFFVIFIFHFLQPSGQVPVPDSTITTRLKEVQELLHQDRIAAKRWWNGWLVGYSAATAGQGAVYFLSDNKATKQDMALGSATTFLGAMGQLITPLVPSDSYTYDQLITVDNYEEWLKEIALREKKGRSWKTHAITGAVNIGSGLITWLGFKRTIWEGIGNFALNTAITEAQIWTQPIKAFNDYQKYYKKYHLEPDSEVLKPGKELHVQVYPGGFSFEFNF
jgi:hypothetical protein